jgi:ribosomal protein S18 acetylase RimI-like enzyme
MVTGAVRYFGMGEVAFREANQSDVAAMARIRAAEWESEEYWRARISSYLEGESNPQNALATRVIYIAVGDDGVVGFIAGHVTRRYACHGELQWIDVICEQRRTGIASQLLRCLAAWFTEQKASRICVDVDPANTVARAFYERHGAVSLNRHWLVWNDIRLV